MMRTVRFRQERCFFVVRRDVVTFAETLFRFLLCDLFFVNWFLLVTALYEISHLMAHVPFGFNHFLKPSFCTFVTIFCPRLHRDRQQFSEGLMKRIVFCTARTRNRKTVFFCVCLSESVQYFSKLFLEIRFCGRSLANKINIISIQLYMTGAYYMIRIPPLRIVLVFLLEGFQFHLNCRVNQ